VAQGGAGEPGAASGPASALSAASVPAGGPATLSGGATREGAERGEAGDARDSDAFAAGSSGRGSAARAAAFRIVSPLEGDRYQIPPDVDPRYATIALRAEGALGDGAVRWWMDGARVPGGRWRLRSGAHTIRAMAASGRVAEVRFEVQ
jgi:hypothetical protein